MLKEIFIVCIVILLVLICNFALQNYITKSSESLVEKLGTLSEKMTSDIENIKENNDINNLINNIENEWEKSKKKWEIFVIHNEIDQIEISFTNLKTAIKTNNKQDASIETEKAKFLLQHEAERDSFMLKNLF